MRFIKNNIITEFLELLVKLLQCILLKLIHIDLENKIDLLLPWKIGSKHRKNTVEP